MEGVIHGADAMIRTTSFGGTSPDVFREKVVRSETECMAECTVRLGRALGGRDDGERWEREVSGRAHPSRGNYVRWLFYRLF